MTPRPLIHLHRESRVHRLVREVVEFALVVLIVAGFFIALCAVPHEAYPR